jgi:acyl-CoA thioester hydrolase
MFQYEVTIRVRYSETDQMGYVYYGNYGAYFEVARTEAFRTLGVNYKELERSGIMMPVLEMKTRYLRPARYDDLLTIKVMLPTKPRGTRITFEYEVLNEAQDLLTRGETTLVFVDMKTSRPIPLPDVVTSKLDAYYP